jgi:sn-glycerol 3-phosphate transport system permease protein
MTVHVQDLAIIATAPIMKEQRHHRGAWGRAVRAFWLLAPSLLFLFLFTYWPVLQVVLTSVRVSESRSGLGNYMRLFADPRFGTAALNNVLFAIGTIVPSLLLALLFALVLKESSRFNSILRTVLVFPLLIPLVGAAALFTFVLLPGEGLIDTWLGRFGLYDTNWLGNPTLALGSIVAITIWKNAGYYMLFLSPACRGFPKTCMRLHAWKGPRSSSDFDASPCRC